MKKFVAILMTALMMVCMVACAKEAAPAEAAAEATADVAMQYITADDLAAVIDSADYTIIDVRKAADYETSHITGSISADMDAAKEGDTAAGEATMKAATEGISNNIVLVCYSGKKYAQVATNALSAIGYDMTKVYTLQDGFNNWVEVKSDLVESN